MLVQFECTYCGFKWTNQVYDIGRDRVYRCLKCDDPNVWTRDISSDKVDYYGTTIVPETKGSKRKKYTGLE